MKIFKGKKFDPKEEVQDVYGPPPFDAEEPVECVYGPPPDVEERIRKEAEEVQCVYGPPSWFGGVNIPPRLNGDPSAPTTPVYDKLYECYKSVRRRTDFIPKIALVLGSGLGAFADENVKAVDTIDYSEIEGFPVSTVPGHKGRFVFGYVGDVPVVVMQGRVHLYEGYPVTDVVLPVRLMTMLGAGAVILTNAAGGLNSSFSPGTIMLISDHVSSFVPNPLIGPNIDQLGTRFPDMSQVYDPALLDLVSGAAAEMQMYLRTGVYAQLTGPSFETPSEIRMLRQFGEGVDAVGMSTVVEAIAVHHAGARVCGLSCISNLAAGLSDTPLTHEEVQQTADRVGFAFRMLLERSIKAIGADLIL